MGDDTNLVLIQKAMTLEKARYEGYENMSAKVSNIEGREVLIKLAKVEKNHYNLLKKQIKSIRKFSEVNLDILAGNKINLLKRENSFTRTISSISTDINIMEEAEAIERKDPPFYEALSEQTTDPKLKKVFQFLKKEESYHLRILEKKLKELEILSSKISAAKDPRVMFYDLIRDKK